MRILLTAESVSPGHPDKLMDYIVDSILDEILAQDPNARVAIDGVFKGEFLTLGGEITTTANVDYESIARRSIREVGYTELADNCGITLHISKQSPDIALGTNDEVQGAGDQGTITGFACSDCDAMIPPEKALADELVRRLYFDYRPRYDFIGPDIKTQVTLSVREDGEMNLNTIVVAIQHTKGTDKKKLEDVVIECINSMTEKSNIITDDDFKLIINGTGEFTIGGPEADSGEVGRKIVVDAYGVRVPVGGGTFNGKDPTKVDRSAAYMARYVAKSIVSADLASVCNIAVSYCIGKADPISVYYDFYGTNKYPVDMIINEIEKLVSFRPADIINTLGLKKPIYSTTGLVGHFGLDGKLGLDGTYKEVPWEQGDLANALIDAFIDVPVTSVPRITVVPEDDENE